MASTLTHTHPPQIDELLGARRLYLEQYGATLGVILVNRRLASKRFCALAINCQRNERGWT